MKKGLAELIGTFALVFCGTGAIVIDHVTNGTIGNLGIAMSFGIIVMVMIYSIGPISGAHMNPAVSISMFLTKKISQKELFSYLTFQFFGAFLASFTLKLLFPTSNTLGETLPNAGIIQSFVLEFILTFFLLFTIVCISSDHNKNSHNLTGIVIGALIGLEACFAGPICGASMNPIRSISPAVINNNTEHLWVYIIAPLIGAILGTITGLYFQRK